MNEPTSKRTKSMATATPSYDELQAQIKKLTEQAEAVRKTEIDSVLTDMKAKIEKYSLTADQLGFGAATKKAPKKASSSSKEAVVMYKKGDLTWSGAARGRKPKWVMEAQAAGEDIEKYRVK
ncbi:H-NS histone family protein [Duganella qianjiadongensis]|uniref:H-NS histone family protein n=1 Tax=Duganella qianjiadongensis TaxID=2692176 RepID=A0ABW9VL38_9BURK|nr:H-NS histone family protein [Duganella qianjiadongensis]MYM40166.1 H-NS histone family protein [Duganella qianjiadongensis]